MTKSADGVPNPEPAAADAAVAPAASAASSPADSADDIAALRAAAAELAALKAEGAAARKADRDARKRAQEEAEKSGELAKALETAKSRLAELEGLEPLAQRWRAHEEAESKRLDAEAAGLPEAVRALYADAGSVESKAKVLAAFRASSGSPAAAAAPKVVGAAPAMGAPPGVTDADVEAALADPSGRKFQEIKQRDPSAVAKFFAGVLSGKSAPSLGIGRFAPGGPRGA
jgi:hypothetical protein